MRVFIAIELSKELKKYFFNQSKIIQRYCIKGNFTREDNFHLTLRFIGESDEKQIEELKNAVSKTAEKCSGFSSMTGNLGFFPRGNKKILWAGLENSTELKKLYQLLEKELESIGYPKEERGLKPHITIGREVVLQSEFDTLKQVISMVPNELFVNKLSLMESTREDGKLVYRPLFSAHFSK
ncbi:MAG: RNA 2',3'-cyclic phosphodiesterase [Bacillota bacterium]